MYQKYEQRSSGASLMLIPLGAITGSMIASVIHISGELSREKSFAEDVQGYNSQINAQLQPNYPDINDLILSNDNGQTFSFHTTDKTGHVEACTGKFEVHSDTAAAVGTIACTQYTVVSNR